MITRRSRPLIGYKASNQLMVRVRDLKNLGKTLEAVVKAGGNTINGISFDIDKPKASRDEARVVAIKDAADKAELYAKAVGYRGEADRHRVGTRADMSRRAL